MTHISVSSSSKLNILSKFRTIKIMNLRINTSIKEMRSETTVKWRTLIIIFQAKTIDKIIITTIILIIISTSSTIISLKIIIISQVKVTMINKIIKETTNTLTSSHQTRTEDNLRTLVATRRRTGIKIILIISHRIMEVGRGIRSRINTAARIIMLIRPNRRNEWK